jgi:2,3-dihydroxyphenylpropionate 1,2-dioxygenase
MTIDYGIVAAAAVPHAPQMLSLPASEDAAQVARLRAAMGALGRAMRALAPDLVIVIGNDHGDDFIVRSVPAFMFHCGPRAAGRDGHAGYWAVDGDAGYALVRAMQVESFDPAFTLDAPLGTFFTIPIEFMGWSRETPVLPLFVNSYVPPQPSGPRCFAFGEALARALVRLRKRAVLIASGGLSHYPGTAAYREPGPDLAADRTIFDQCTAGNLRHLLAYDEPTLDRIGNIELRAWQILAGAIGQAKPDVALFEPNWHHTYGLLGWSSLAEPAPEPKLYYTATPSAQAELARALHALRTDEDACRAFIDDPAAFARGYDLTSEQRALLVAFDEAAMRDRLGVHALLTSGAARRLGLVRKTKVKT